MALSASRALTERLGEDTVPPLLKVKIAASVTCYQGGMAMLDAGYAKPAAAAVGKLIIGRFERTYNNASGAAGDITGEVRRGVFKFNNSLSGDLIAQAQVGTICYAVDDETVAKTSNSGARSVAGVVVQVETDGVFVQMGLMSQGEVDAAAPDLTAATYVAPTTGTLTGTVNGVLVDVAAAAGACAGAGSPSATNVDSAIATAVAPIVSGVNEQLKEIVTKQNAILAALVAAHLMASS